MKGLFVATLIGAAVAAPSVDLWPYKTAPVAPVYAQPVYAPRPLFAPRPVTPYLANPVTASAQAAGAIAGDLVSIPGRLFGGLAHAATNAFVGGTQGFLSAVTPRPIYGGRPY